MHDDLGTAEVHQPTTTPSAVPTNPHLDGSLGLAEEIAGEITKRKKVPPIAVFLHRSLLPIPADHAPRSSLPS